MVHHVIFDMDGVILDSERLVRRSWTLAGEELGLEQVGELFLQCMGTNRTWTRQKLMETYGPDFPYEAFQRRTSQLYWEVVDGEGCPLKPGARELLEWLASGPGRTGLASSTRLAVVERELRQAGVWHLFDTVIGGDLVAHSKPAPDIYLLACREMGVAPEAAWAVEDSYNGVRSAHRAGLRVVMVPDLLPPTGEMEQLAQAILPDLSAVEEYWREDAT